MKTAVEKLKEKTDKKLKEKTALEKLKEKIAKIQEKDENLRDQKIEEALTGQDILTIGLLSVNDPWRVKMLGSLMRADERKKALKKLSKKVKEEDLVAVEVPGGGKCKITVFMTKDAAKKERGR